MKKIRSIDDWLLDVGQRGGLVLYHYRYLIAVLLVGFVVWAVVFNIAVIDYLSSTSWNSRSAWLGPIGSPGSTEILGFTVYYQFEGYSDYSFYYVHWGHNMLNGVMPYSDAFGYLNMDGIINRNGAYMFPPLTAYLYGAGIGLGNLVGIDNWGIGFLIASFGFLTALPTYGIAKELSGNPRIGEIAALTYLLNPLVLFHIDFIWLNPSPFYFFFFAGFYALLRDKRHTGTLLIVTAALFKQTAWFLGIPLVIYLLIRRRPGEVSGQPVESSQSEKKSLLRDFIDFINEYADVKGFLVSVGVVLAYVGAIMLPYLVAQPWFWNYWRLALGSFSFEGNFTDSPAYGIPIRLPVLAIMYNQPQLAEAMDFVISSGAPLVFGATIAIGVMMLTQRYVGDDRAYMRRILFITFLLMLWVNLVGPRGVFKYYFSMFAPFFSIFASYRMTTTEKGVIPVSASTVWAPVLCTLAIFIPDRNFYLAFVVVIFAAYLSAPILGRLYKHLKRPFSFLRTRVSEKTELRYSPQVPPLRHTRLRSRVLEFIRRFVSILVGILMVWYGLTTGFASIGGTMMEVLNALILSSVLLFVGPQLALGPFERLLPRISRNRLATVSARIMSGTLAALQLGFGIVTYVLSWDLEALLIRQLLVFSGTFLVIWTPTLVLELKNRTRIVADILLIMGISLGVAGWWLQGGTILPVIGLVCLALCALHLMSVVLTIWSTPKVAPVVDEGQSTEQEDANSG
jgi:hypothetical protein